MPAREQLVGIFLLLLALASGTAAARYVYTHRQPELTLDRDHCPAALPALTLAAFDITDPPPVQEQERVVSRLLAIAEHMQQHERLVLHVISGRAEDSAAPWPLPGFPRGFRLCKPVDPNTVDPLMQNERLIRATYEKDFLDPLRAALAELVKGGSANRSPILQAIEVMMWSPLFRADISNRTLIIFSDLLVHTRQLSQLTQPLGDTCKVLASDIGRRLQARNWHGVRIVLERLRNPRDAQHQSPEHLRFWSRLFYRLGAAQVFDGSHLIANDAGTCPIISLAKPSKTIHARSHRNR